MMISFTGRTRPSFSVTRRTCWCPTYCGQWEKTEHSRRRYGATHKANPSKIRIIILKMVYITRFFLSQNTPSFGVTWLQRID